MSTTSTRPGSRRNADQQRAALHRFELSNLSAQDFCRQEGLSLSSFRRWQHKLALKPLAPGFVELRAPSVAAAAADGPWAVELDLPGGICLRLRSGR